MYNLNEEVIYSYVKIAHIINVHHDDAPNIYYTIKLEGKDRFPNTNSKNLHMIKKNGPNYPFDKGDKVLYIKNIDTKIYDIINSNNKKLYKIKINDTFKLVKENRLTKLY